MSTRNAQVRYMINLWSGNELVLFYERVSTVYIHFCSRYLSARLQHLLQQLFHIHILFQRLFHLRMQNSLFLFRWHSSLFARTLHVLLYCYPALSFLFLSFSSRWVENAPPRITIKQQRRMAGCRAPIKWRIVYSKWRTTLQRDTNRTSRRP